MRHAAKGNIIISLPHLGPEGLSQANLQSSPTEGIKVFELGGGKWIVTDSFNHEYVISLVTPLLAPEDEMRYQFGEHQILFRKIDSDRIETFVNGVSVNPVFEPSRRSQWGADQRLVRKE